MINFIIKGGDTINNNDSLLKRNKLKITPRRKALINIFEQEQKYFSAEEIHNMLKKNFTRCGLPSVYRNLESLVECGILFRIVIFNDGKKYYGLCGQHDTHHHHVICIKCKKIDILNQCSIDDNININGFKILNHIVQLNGICYDCQI